MTNGLSLCLLVRNEELNLNRCLNSAAHTSSEVVVVDTGSTDRTRQVAAAFGAKIFDFNFSHVDFAAARNFALAQATGRWILMLDADEVLDQATVHWIDQLVQRDDNAGYFLERLNPAIDYVVRLFPSKPEHRYRGRVHETIDDAILDHGGRLLKTPIRILHNFVSDPAARRRKNHWYVTILKEEIAADPTDYSRLDFLAAEYHQLEMFDEATAIAEQIARVRPLDARAHLFAGTYHLLYKPDFPRARADFQAALRLKPDYPEAECFLRLLDERENSTSNSSG